MYTSSRTLTVSLAALLCLFAATSPSSALAREVNASSIGQTSAPLYSRSEEGASNDEAKHLALTGVTHQSSPLNAQTLPVEHGLKSVRRHSKGIAKKRHGCSAKKSSQKQSSGVKETNNDTTSYAAKKGKSSHPSGSSSHSHSGSDSSSHSGSGSDSSSDSSSSSSSSSHGGSGSSSSSDSSSSSSSSASNSSSSSSSSSSGSVSSSSGSGPYTRVQQNRGSSFWSGNWNFWSQADPTHGQVQFTTESQAKSQNLIGMKDGAAFMRVSNKDMNGGNRPSVRFESKEAYNSGLMIFDVVKMPVGCGVWPALWTTKGDNWPHNGEIDVMEGVGYTAGGKNANQMTVHLGQDSPLELNRRSANTKRASYLGQVMENGSNCNQWGSGNTGCAFFDSNKNGPSWGEAFNSAGGGVWAMQFGNGGGVKIWFWGRKSGKIPDELKKADVSPKKLNPSSWGTPMANFQNSAVDSMIKAQNIIMDITIGGDWAGNVPLDGHCKGQNLQEAIKKGSNYNDAEFIINGIDIYCKNGQC